jgi:predicted ATPase
MKIQAIYLHNVGPIVNQKLDFYDDWSGKIFNRVLFSGPNGSGKSILLKAVAELWQATGHWLEKRTPLPANQSATSATKKWLQQWGGIAMILTELPFVTTKVGLVFGKQRWFQEIEQEFPEIQWLGEIKADQKDTFSLKLPDTEWLTVWSEARSKLILTFDPANTPNMIYLDAEECRWVPPKRRVGRLLPDDSRLRWLVKYQVTEDWQGQLESSLINLKVTKLHAYHEMIRQFNQFLQDKRIHHEVLPGNRLQVILPERRGHTHGLDALSAGERQVLIKLYLVSRWLEPGGIVLVDEPDLYLHPSLVEGFLATIETLVEKQPGQLLITSHLPSLWEWYETRDKRIELGGTL